jgi:hypothetical protein
VIQSSGFTLKTLIEIGGGPFEFYSPSIKSTASGWIEIDKNVMPESRGKNYDDQKKMVEEKRCRLPSALEAVVLNLMVFAFTGVRLYGEEPFTYARCSETVNGNPAVVGQFGSKGLDVNCSMFNFDNDGYGVAAVLDHW